MVNQELNTFKKDFYSCLPKLAVYFGIIFAIWLVTIAILGPLGKGVFIGGVESSSVVLWSALLAIFILLVLVLQDLLMVVHSLGGMFAVQSNVDAKGRSNIHQAIKYVIDVIIVAVIYIFARELILSVSNTAFNQSLLGVVLVVITLWIIWMLYRAGMAASAEIGAYAAKAVQAPVNCK